MVTLPDLLTRGYFPKELPPPFRSDSYGALIGSGLSQPPPDYVLKASGNRASVPVVHNLARVGSLRRELALVNPINYYQLSSIIQTSWTDLLAYANRSSFSITKPIYTPTGNRAIGWIVDFRGRLPYRARSRAAGRYLLKTDLANFYPTVYTHAIPWALHSKPVAKANRNDFSYLGNKLDLATRTAQDLQTTGIPIGPDTSVVVSEALLAALDEQLQQTIPINGFRFVDDYELTFKTYSEAEEALAAIQGLAQSYQLRLNESKTEIIELPTNLDSPWSSELRNFPWAKDRRAQNYGLYGFFDAAFELARKYPEAAVLSYAIGRMNSVIIDSGNWTEYQDVLMQCVLAEPGVLPNVMDQLVRYGGGGYSIDTGKCQDVFAQLVRRHGPLGQGSEVAWALWGSILFDIPIDTSAASIVTGMEDSVVALLALDAYSKKLLPTSTSFNQWMPSMAQDGLYGEQWLLSYEANVKGWLPSSSASDHVAADPNFGFLKTNGVSFYDAAVASSVQPRRPIQRGQPEPEVPVEPDTSPQEQDIYGDEYEYGY